jgi:hypothetical protein
MRTPAFVLALWLAGTLALPLSAADKSRELNPQAKSFLWLQQWANEGYYKDDVDLEDVDGYFQHIFSRLPDEVTVYPSENYFYFIDHIGGRQIWGNIRLPASRRERGVIAFAYAEFSEFPNNATNYLSRSKYFAETNGVSMKSTDPFTWAVSYRKKSVTFHLHKLSTDPPKSFALKTNEAFIERTFDESGIQFFLLFNTTGNYFFWVLNEEEIVPDEFIQLEKDILVGRRTGFAFWIDPEKRPRKVLAAVRKTSVTRNDYYDGPFDQLADNYVDQNKISMWMERAFPSLKGRIDKYGYYTDLERPSRVALSCYGNYDTPAEVIDFVKRAKAASDAYQFISRAGNPSAADRWAQ